ncbi:MAG: DUF3833 domain-containing protein [Gammaproteobacteria bacterium]|nr:DUF3833 domain-containing protein [Gammaproteobacteria bacterium]
MVKFSLVLLSLGLISACTSVSVEEYSTNQPAMDIREFFDGSLSAHGIVKNRSGKVIRYFNASIIASWDDGIGKLDETFYFDDGEQQRRIWTLQSDNSGNFTGTANDVIGSSKMNVSGNSLFMQYTLLIAYDEDTLDLQIDDRMYRVSDKVIINESTMSKWGFEVGQIILVIEKIS